MEQDSEFLLLETIHDLTQSQADISQRDLSRAINMSLGMTNALLKRLSQKGFIIIQKISPRNVSYVLTPDGINELAGRTYRYLKRTIKKVVDYKEVIVTVVKEAKKRGFSRIGLLGQSDIDFIIEWAASSVELEYCTFASTDDIPADSFVFVSENLAQPPVPVTAQMPAIHIAEILSGALT
ncbi:MAG: winged helix-turn-helix transcriptional regulator [Spirochaetales bacterium]|nr:winged helix-turn-helix transcriptional regulator [Spirochaetales bacterium]HNQ97238.1 winged helix-turn-helix transcriptional regulator [Treponemataceae bacterium]